MSTSGGFTPPAAPECAYDPYMTRAEALALRAASALNPNCVVVITDGPVIGTPGNTSPTQIELNPVAPDDLGRDARVHTTFDNTAFSGLYNIDDGAAGSINSLTDHWNNHISDEDTDAPTVHTQFPYHLSGTNLRDNTVNDSTLTGWDTALAAGGRANDNSIRNSTVDLTGRTGVTSFFDQNVIESSTVAANTPTSFVRQNQITGAVVRHLGTSAASWSFQNNVLLTGAFNVDAATTVQVTANNNVFGGTSGGYRVAINGRTAGQVTISGNRLFNFGGGSQELLVTGAAGTCTISGNQISAGSITVDGAAPGNFSLTSSELRSVTITKAAGCIAPNTFQNNKLSNCTITLGAANNASTNLVQQVDIRSGLLQLLGPVSASGRNDFQFMDADGLTVTVAATATGGVNINGGYYNISSPGIQQNRVAGGSSLAFYSCDMRGGVQVIDNGTTDPGAPVENSFNRCRFSDVIVNVGNMSGRVINTIAQQLDCTGSTLTVSGLGTNKFLDKGRMLGATLDNAGFQIQTFELTGMTKTLTADQTNRLGNPSFDNFL